jgi:hypothetical protein
MSQIIAYANLLRNSGITITASTEATGYEKENIYDWLTFDYWKPTAVPAYLTVDFGSAVAVDYFGLAAHDLADNSADIVLQYSTDDFSADINDAFTAVTPSDNAPILKTFTSVSKRYWRIKLTGGISSLGVAAFGARLDVDTVLPVGYRPMTQGQSNRILTSESDGGQFLGRSVLSQAIKGAIQLDYLTKSWVRTNWPTLRDHIEQYPFFYLGEPDNYPDEVQLVWLDGKLDPPRYSHPTLMSVKIPVKGQA